MKKILIGATLFLPVVVWAEEATAAVATNGLAKLLETLKQLASQFYGLILVLIIAAFAWGVLKFVFQSGEDQDKGKSMMIWSIVSITVLFSIWGIVSIFQQTLSLNEGSNQITAPKVPTINP